MRISNHYIPALVIKKENLDRDVKIKKQGDRKIVVTQLYKNEIEANKIDWEPPEGSGDKCPVLLMANTEVAYFNDNAFHNKHYHRKATEIYIVTQGTMQMEISDNEKKLSAGDMVIVNPLTSHYIKSCTNDFKAFVVCINCHGQEDKVCV